MSEVPLEQEELGEIHFTTYLSDDESVQFDSQAMFSVPNDGFFPPVSIWTAFNLYVSDSTCRLVLHDFLN